MTPATTPATTTGTPTHHAAVPATPDKKSYGGLVLLMVVIVILIIILQSIPGKKTTRRDTLKKQLTTVVQQTFDTYPPIDPQTFEINGSFSEKKIIRDGYYVSFVCNQPYQIRKSNDKLVESEANKSANIGLYKAEESIENSLLEFRTLNDATTTMTLIFTPMKIKKH